MKIPIYFFMSIPITQIVTLFMSKISTGKHNSVLKLTSLDHHQASGTILQLQQIHHQSRHPAYYEAI